MQLKQKFQKIIEKNSFMVLATVDADASPWITPVFYAHDKEYNFYWYSGKNTKHSQLLKENQKVAITIYHPNSVEDGGAYLTGTASELTEEELPHALEIYFSKALPNDVQEKEKMLKSPEDFLNDSVLRMYRFIPGKIYVSGEAKKWNGKWIDEREEVK